MCSLLDLSKQIINHLAHRLPLQNLILNGNEGLVLLEQIQTLFDYSKRLPARADIEFALQSIAHDFGFQSAIVFEYGLGLRSISDLVDSDPCRRHLWDSVLDAGVVRGCVSLTTSLAQRAPYSRFDLTYFSEDTHCLQAAQRLQLIEGVAVPVMSDAGLAGVVKFCGHSDVSDRGMISLYTAAHMMFSALQNVRENDVVRLTPREKQVMELTAMGHTTPETASILGMSERTVSQHTDNVADKMGTRNRVHTIANLVRLNLV